MLFDTSNNRLACCPSATQSPALFVGYILAFATNEGFISLDKSMKSRQPCKVKSFPNPTGKEPSYFLRYAKVTV